MQTTSALYKSIVSGNHSFESKVTIAGYPINASSIYSIKKSKVCMNQKKPTIGCASAATLSIRIKAPTFTIPKQAKIVVFIRAVNATQVSEWIQQGTYYIDTRKYTQTASGSVIAEFTAFDAMMKAEADYPDTSHDWPYLDKSVVAEVASTIGVTVDSRTNQFLTSGYMIGLPVGYTMRETLEHIAGAYGGNFVITSENKLLFVPLYGFDLAETGSYLADESGNALVFGNEGWYILV